MKYLPKTYYDFLKSFSERARGVKEKKVRARDEDGRYKADDKSTPDVNEAYKTIEVPIDK